MMLNRNILLFAWLLLSSIWLSAQELDPLIEEVEKIPAEKIYIHTDRDLYVPGETIWLKSYLTDSRSGRLLPGTENIYIQLTNKSGQRVVTANILSLNGQASNQISLPDTLSPGNYILSAYTDYLRNFDSDIFFYKPLTILKSSSSQISTTVRQEQKIETEIASDIKFLPEGGILLEGASNVVAFKGIDKNGYGVDISGKVKDDSGNEVTLFSSDYKGMGLFFLTPEKGKSYSIEIDGMPSYDYKLDSLIVPEGIKLQLVNQTSKDLLINLTSNTDRFIEETFFFVTMHRGNVLFYQPVQIEDQNQLLRFGTDMLRGGINQLILLDSMLRPVSERLVFHDRADTQELSLKLEKEKFLRRSEARLIINSSGLPEEKAHLSVSIAHEDVIIEENPSHNITSWLLISSELKGFTENPTDYFNDSIIDAEAKQRLLMLTNGWNSYYWNKAPHLGSEIVHAQKAGLDITGTATMIQSGEPLKRGEINMVINSGGEIAILEQVTDASGKFVYPGLLFYDSATVFIQAKNTSRRQRSQITLEPQQYAGISDTYTNALKYNLPVSASSRTSTLSAIEAGIRRSAIRERSTTTTVEVVQQPGDGHYRLYEQADQVIEVPVQVAAFGNIIDFIEGKVAGLDINGDNIVLRGAGNASGSSNPLFLIDGIPLTEHRPIGDPDELMENNFRDMSSGSVRKIKSIPIGDIERVEILKSPQNLAMFGVDGANGVIAIYTRHGRSDQKDGIKEVLEQRIAGFSASRQFYTPEYKPGSRVMRSTDIRATLHWEPEVELEQGMDTVTFYTSDLLGRYRIMVEGISDSGKIYYGQTWLDVVIKE